MTREPRNRSHDAAAQKALDDLLGFLNFSSGAPDRGFERNCVIAQAASPPDRPWGDLRERLEARLDEIEGQTPAFADMTQARAAIAFAFDEVYPAYRRHHRDLLFHLEDEDLQRPFFLARIFEAVLAAGPPWDGERTVQTVLDRLNDFLGYRPLAILEDGRASTPYPHERVALIPLYIEGAGLDTERYHDLLERALLRIAETPPQELAEAHFEPANIDEIALDPRAHDQANPVNKRTNYIFGEWDPDRIDNKGNYRRFVLRQIILDALIEWIENSEELPYEERLFDASAVLCGTMLMASSISGSGPNAFSSDVSLGSLHPLVARRRDAFYERLLRDADGERARRLRASAESTQQPFGHVRHALNLSLARYTAQQAQYQFLSQMFAQMGFREIAREYALAIPAASTRIDCEITWRIAAAHRELERGEVDRAAELIAAADEYLHRGIDCGAIVDPWNILGFQGLIPLFNSREDALPDPRIHRLLEIVEQLFGVHAHALSEAAAAGREDVSQSLSRQFESLGDEWDRYATTTVVDLPKIYGRASWQSALHVAEILSEWRSAGEAAGDIAFWRERVDRFQTPKSYALVIDALLERGDHVAAMGLLMHWLSESERVELESGPYAIHSLLVRWLRLVVEKSASEDGAQLDLWQTVRRMFAFLEVNAGEYWDVPQLELGEADGREPQPSPPEDDPDLDLFGAAYEQVTYVDSTDDGHFGDTLDSQSFSIGDSEIEAVHRRLESRLRFLATLGCLWQIAGTALQRTQDVAAESEVPAEPDRGEVVREWLERADRLRADLKQLMLSIWNFELQRPAGDHDSNVEFDVQLQSKYMLVRFIGATQINLALAARVLRTMLPPPRGGAKTSQKAARYTDRLYRGVIQRRGNRALRSALSNWLASIRNESLLYIPLENGGHPASVVATQTRHADLRFLLEHLPGLGLLRETWHVLKAAYRMEQYSRPKGMAVTEFDRLFRTALRSTLEVVVESAEHWTSKRFGDRDLVDIVDDILDQYLNLWLPHRHTMRLSPVESLNDEDVWHDIRDFIATYGAELFHPQMLTLGHVRAVLYHGVDFLLDVLVENRDPIEDSRLLDDLESGQLDRERARHAIRLIYSIVDDHYDRFVEYNTTTTQSDYGDKFYCLLDILRVEAAYDSDEWSLIPFTIAHEVLVKSNSSDATTIWEQEFQLRSAELADRHVQALSHLETKYGIHLPVVSDHIRERFVKPLTVNRMLALAPRAVEEARAGNFESEVVEELQAQIDDYLESTIGSGVDVPDWLQRLYRAALSEDREDPFLDDPSHISLPRPVKPLTLQSVRRQINHWLEPF